MNQLYIYIYPLFLIFYSHIGHSVQFSVVAQSCLTLCDSMDCRLPGSSVQGILQARTLTGVGSRSILQRIFQTQKSNSGLLRCRQILYCQSHQGSPGGLSGRKINCSSHACTTSGLPFLVKTHGKDRVREGQGPGSPDWSPALWRRDVCEVQPGRLPEG